ncbi:MAG: WecB/TagA/CpsF family glycosyltransferase [Chloroflexi bacterium]|nr:WecB/TagA/CpsF family glycosyltransferase [Chloroflexota bacterium]MCI0650186.1 WecB/TagA/CpsF family glycosyltransferase [Chloroflexota bacterium]MCI0729503.1 WecB/TagA/CpsF family glycosyltransferase [Chloroflexota bacterium]
MVEPVEVANQINILGVRVHALTVALLHQQIDDEIRNGRHSLVLNVNVHCLNLAYELAWLRRLLNNARVVFCDGAGVRLGARILGYHLPQRITYADWIWQLADFCAERGHTLFLLGARPGVVQRAVERLEQRYPRLEIVGVQDGYFNKEREDSENKAVVEEINRLQPDILIVGFGMPLQERWLMENWERLDVHVALTGGAVFDYISGELRRPSSWMTNHGLEWLGRLVIEPRRLWRRYIVGNPRFLWRVLKERFNLLPGDLT